MLMTIFNDLTSFRRNAIKKEPTRPKRAFS